MSWLGSGLGLGLVLGLRGAEWFKLNPLCDKKTEHVNKII